MSKRERENDTVPTGRIKRAAAAAALSARREAVTDAIRDCIYDFPTELISIMLDYNWTARIVYLDSHVTDSSIRSLYLDEHDRVIVDRVEAVFYGEPVAVTSDPDATWMWSDTRKSLGNSITIFNIYRLGWSWSLINSVILHPVTRRFTTYRLATNDIPPSTADQHTIVSSTDKTALDIVTIRMVKGDGWTRPSDHPVIWNNRYLCVNTDECTRIYDAWYPGTCTVGLYFWLNPYQACAHPTPVAFGTTHLDLYTPLESSITRLRIAIDDIANLDHAVNPNPTMTDIFFKRNVDTIPAPYHISTMYRLVACGTRLYAVSDGRPVQRFHVESNTWTKLDCMIKCCLSSYSTAFVTLS